MRAKIIKASSIWAKVYEEFYKTLDKDCSIYWEDYKGERNNGTM